MEDIPNYVKNLINPWNRPYTIFLVEILKIVYNIISYVLKLTFTWSYAC